MDVRSRRKSDFDNTLPDPRIINDVRNPDAADDENDEGGLYSLTTIQSLSICALVSSTSLDPVVDRLVSSRVYVWEGVRIVKYDVEWR